jgi:hypothetical protein
MEFEMMTMFVAAAVAITLLRHFESEKSNQVLQSQMLLTSMRFSHLMMLEC